MAAEKIKSIETKPIEKKTIETKPSEAGPIETKPIEAKPIEEPATEVETSATEKQAEVEHGLLIVHTGDGKGKTTAALGLALRAFGGGLRVLILQYIKGGQRYGELDALDWLSRVSNGRIAIKQCGLGFTARGEEEEHARAAKEALAMSKSALTNGKWDMVILDEINYAVTMNLISEEEMMKLVDARPEKVHLVMTGRNAAQSLIDRADLVTEMKLIKHPFLNGIHAQLGIEF